MRRCRRCQSYKERCEVDRCHIKKKNIVDASDRKECWANAFHSTKHLPMPYSFSSTHQHGAPSLRYSGVPHFPNWGITYENAPQTLTVHLFQAASWRSVTSIHLPLTYMIDLWLSLPPNCPSRIKPSSHVFVEEEEEKNIDVKRKSGCQRQLSLFFCFLQENKYLQHILLGSIFIPYHAIPSLIPNLNRTQNRTRRTRAFKYRSRRKSQLRYRKQWWKIHQTSPRWRTGCMVECFRHTFDIH